MKIFAYVDPGFGALIWQAVVAGIVGFLFYLKKTRRWIVDMLRKMFGRDRETKTATTEVAATVNDPATEVETKIEMP